MVKKVIVSLDSSKASGVNCIPAVVLKNCEPKPSYILVELYVSEGVFPDCWKVSSVAPVFKNISERPTTKDYHPVSLLFVVRKVFGKLVNNKIVDHLENCCFFVIPSFSINCRSSNSCI